MDLIRDRDQGGFREQRNEYGSRVGGTNETLDVSVKQCLNVGRFSQSY